MPAEAQALRVSQCLDQVDQANTIFNFVFFALQRFVTTGDSSWDYRLVASVNVSSLLETLGESDENTIVRASREIAFQRLPQLLCISLVASLETCLTDVTEIHVRADNSGADDEIAKDVAKVMRGGPAEYLPRVAERLDLTSIGGHLWDEYRELVATRNIIVHSTGLVTDQRYVRNAGSYARAEVGEQLPCDNIYLLKQYNIAKGALFGLLREFNDRCV